MAYKLWTVAHGVIIITTRLRADIFFSQYLSLNLSKMKMKQKSKDKYIYFFAAIIF